MKGFADIAKLLLWLIEEKINYQSTTECEASWRKLKAALCTRPVLAFPQQNLYILNIHAINSSIEYILSQIQNGQERVIEYFSKMLPKPERSYCVTRKELLTIVKFMDHFHKYLYGQHFKIMTEHAALKYCS